MPKLQVALDFINLEEAIEIAKKVADSVDIMEAGTPLIKAEGLETIRRLKREFPKHIINADMKTADVGDLEVKIAAEAGADIVSVLGAAPIETIRAADREGEAQGSKLAVDLIGIDDVEKRVPELTDAGADYYIVHCGIDEQKAGKDPLDKLRRVAKLTDVPLVAAGGLDAKKAVEVLKIPNVEVVIVGGGITKATDPAKAAAEIKKVITK